MWHVLSLILSLIEPLCKACRGHGTDVSPVGLYRVLFYCGEGQYTHISKLRQCCQGTELVLIEMVIYP